MTEGYILAFPGTLMMFGSEEAAVNARSPEVREKQIGVYRVKQVRLLAPDPPPEQSPKDKRLDILEEDANVLGQRLDAEENDPEPPDWRTPA